jgi:predicted methyltransferase
LHRVKGITPWEDTLEKVRAARVFRGAKVLDVCTGLGYTAIASLDYGASSVVTVERDENVLAVAAVNPWSRRLADPRVKIALADAADFVRELPDASFDRVVHDPPRLALAGELYGLDFYRELYRVLKPGGVLFHYVGEPGRARGLNIAGGVSGRLKRAGFEVLGRKAMGVVARKPRQRRM